jgi:hypothetical protein
MKSSVSDLKFGFGSFCLFQILRQGSGQVSIFGFRILLAVSNDAEFGDNGLISFEMV